MKVRNMVSLKGNDIANQFIIEDEEKVVFQSYQAKIAEYNKNTKELKVFQEWDYSKTTLKYFKMFIREETCYDYDSKNQFEKDAKNIEKIKFIN